ncbi:MAG: NADH-quinone oxidoreductase subunit F [Promethearchaeota archaeon Loki_b31]|nr:MAG: NADH-quinone oxidoreductase subunit F [Candidatus Lokiarchaeota archaeon Loki_b31]
MTKLHSIKEFEELSKKIIESQDSKKHIISLSSGTCGYASGSIKVGEALKQAIKGYENKINLKLTGCHGFCAAEPNIIIFPEKIFYKNLKPEDAPNIIQSILKGEIIDNLVISENGTKYDHIYDIPFYKLQKRILTGDNPLIDPTNIEDYIAIGGYKALAKALSMHPKEIIEEIKKSGLRGRGGAGFSTGIKWEIASKQKSDVKYIICNADEGDPGAYMDRNLLEGNPQLIIEGMIIGAYSIGANKGWVYVRDEYPLAVKNITINIKKAREMGVLGKNILNTGFDFDIEITRGAGAFVCGEETALIHSIEGKRGNPSQRPPFPAQKGLFGQPTNINNVETWANVPKIIEKGADWYANIGTKTSKGTKIFSLVGKVENTGLVEVPMGITIKEIVYDIGDGNSTGKNVKAIQTGGPSGGCIPQDLFNLPIDYESLKQAGSIMGSGGMIVLDEDTCMVDFAKYFTNFLQNESCGKCSICREGTQRMFEILTDITEGKANVESIDLLEELGHVIKDTSLCGLGQTAPNSVLSTLRYFRNEYLEHILEHYCRAGVCTSLLKSPCENSCPVHLNIPGFIQLFKENRLEEAYELIMLDNPLPATTGRICFAPCNNRCKRVYIDETINTRSLHRYISDTIYKMKKDEEIIKRFIGKKLPTTGKKIAIIGAGPSGLTAAYYLVRLGHLIDVYDKKSKPGGKLLYSIPEYRLPTNVLEHEIDIIRKLGVNFILKTEIGKEIQLNKLIEDYDAIYITTGTQKIIPLNVPDCDAPGVLLGIEELEKIKNSDFSQNNDKIVIIGGGNTAIDVARSLKRLGGDVTIAYRRTLRDMPANEEEIKEAMKENIEFMFMVSPHAIVSNDDNIKGIELMKMKGGIYDPSGRRKPIPIGETVIIPCDKIYTAIGERININFVECTDVSIKGTVEINPTTLQSSNPKVFAGGDFITGPTTVVNSMSEGKKAARNINNFLIGDDNFSELYKDFDFKGEIPLDSEISPKIMEIEIPVKERISNFKEVRKTLSKEQALNEALRCLRCDLEIIEKNK